MSAICASGRAGTDGTWSLCRRAPGSRTRRSSCGSPLCVCSTTSWSRRASAIAIRSVGATAPAMGAAGAMAWCRGSRRCRGSRPTSNGGRCSRSRPGESLRNRLMLALAYDAALRREELCLLATGDLDPAHRTVRVRAQTTKTRRGRVVPYSAVAGQLLAGYLAHRRSITRERGALFVSESPRNRAAAISPWTWSKVVRSIAVRAGVEAFSTHTLRHLCLTDLARSGWELHPDRDVRRSSADRDHASVHPPVRP